jgi:CRP-like cAMP-binding protein
MEKIGYLSKIDLFCELQTDDLKELERIGPMNTVEKGQIILSPQFNIKGVYLLKEGFVRLYRLNEKGKELTINILGSGNIFGELETFSMGIRGLFAESLTQSVLCVLRKPDFEEFILQRPKVVLKLLEVMSRRANEAEEMLEQIAYSDVRTRIGNTLLKLADDFGTAAGEYTRLDVP